MPTYEYECKSCGHNFDIFQNMKDAPLLECPECGKEVRRLIRGGSGVIFKGSGFYVNDKNSGNAKKPASRHENKSAEKPDGKKGEPSGSAGSEAACASCPASAASGGSCPASEKTAG